MLKKAFKMMGALKHFIAGVGNIDDRNSVIFKNISLSFVFKFLSILISFVMVRLSIELMGHTTYGLWLTIVTILNWIALFDMGFGNGFRNKLTESLALQDFIQSKQYVSTAYLLFTGVFSTFIIVAAVVALNLDWSYWLNYSVDENAQIVPTIIISITGCGVLFVLRLINILLTADQKVAKVEQLSFIAQVAIFIAFFICKILGFRQLIVIACLYAILPIFVFSIANIFLFLNRYRNIRPEIKYFRWDLVKEILGDGSKFFVIQVAGLLIYSTDNVLISHFLGSDVVTIYSIPFRYFSILLVAFNLMVQPFWSMTTKAYVQGDLPWVRKNVRTLIRLWLVTFAGGVLMLSLCNFVFDIWIGNNIEVPFMLSLVNLLYAVLMCWGAIFNSILYAIGRLNVVLALSCCSFVLGFPLALLLITKTNLGVYAVPISCIAYTLLVAIVLPIYFKKILNEMSPRDQRIAEVA
jgi:O-antigen/teichoic acid export membrane protein